MSTGQLNFIHRFEPAEEQSDARTLLLLHGTGGNENQMLPLAHAIAPGAAILSPRGKVLENGNPRFFRRFAEGVFDEEDIIFRANELADFTEEACREYQLDDSNLIAIGYSNGANIAVSLLLLRPEVLSGAVLFRPMVPLVPKEMPQLGGKHIFITAGESDPIVTVKESKRLYDLLKQAGADVTLYWEKSGHTITDGDIQAARKWLERNK